MGSHNKINWADHILNFVAVIVGVSLAFFVNDNSEQKKRKEEYDEAIRSFLEEFEADRSNYVEYQIPSNRNQVDDISDVLLLILNGESDSLAEKFQLAININNYFPSGVTFNSLVSSGKLDLIDDFQLRKELSNYHKVLSEEARMRGELQVEFYMNQLMPWLLKNADFTNPSIESLQNKNLVNTLIIYQSLVANKVDHYEYLASRIDSLELKLNNLIETE